MSYSFKDEVVSKLPTGSTFSRIYSLNENESSVEYMRDGIKSTVSMKKVDLTDYFLKVPSIRMPEGASYNDLYAKIGLLYGLGLTSNVDYFNPSLLKLSSSALYVELPISSNSYGYKGVIRCYVVLDAFNGICTGIDRNVCDVKIADALFSLKVRNYFMSKPVDIDTPYYVENSLSLEFIFALAEGANVLGDNGYEFVKSLLIGSVLKETYSDGLSDIAIIITKSNELYQIRYLGNTIKNNGDDDSTSDNSQGLPDGNGDSSAENPVSGEGDIITGEQSEHPNSSLDLDVVDLILD